jgi:hypothetical protein
VELTKQKFTQRSVGFTGRVDDMQTLDLNSEQMEFRKNMLTQYFTKLVTGEYDEAFVRSLDHVGRIHRNLKRKKSGINVEYIHINALFGFVCAGLMGAILDAGLPKEAEKATVVAFTKLLWLQNDFFGNDAEYINLAAKYYVREAKEEGNSDDDFDHSDDSP